MVAITSLGMNYENPRPYQTRKGAACCAVFFLHCVMKAASRLRVPFTAPKEVMVAMQMVAISFLGMNYENPRPY